MECSLLEWLYYNVTCIVWSSNNIHGAVVGLQTVADEHTSQRKHRGPGTFCSWHAQKDKEKHPTPLELKHVEVESRII